ncbi:MAG: class I SAM-dependent methyltransferase [Acidobacteria bacterium]|nr:class I SAM-dependent methyltransferase [Acidobacteriota bacterium]
MTTPPGRNGGTFPGPCAGDARAPDNAGDAVERRRTRRFFNLVAPAFHLIDRNLIPAYREVLEGLRFPPEDTVLDLATGTGTLALAFAERGHTVTGIDFAGRLLARARRRLPGGDLRQMDLAELPSLPAASWDGVAMAYLLHGLSPAFRRFVLCEAARLARRWILVFDYPGPGPLIVRIIERIEGPHYPGFIARPFEDHAAEADLAVAGHGVTSHHGGWWLLRPGAGTPSGGEELS